MSDQPTWIYDAACTSQDVDVFFPGPGRGARNLAKSICSGCSVSTECLEYALNMPTWNGFEVLGVWGGTTAADRAELRKSRPPRERANAARHGSVSMYTSHGCRCEPCVKATREYNRAYQARKAAS